MTIKIGVEQFGKIEKAEITLGRLILFVGENNSGKTYMMQLLYGVISAIVNRTRFLREKLENIDSQYIVDADAIFMWVQNVNEYLEREKEQLVKDIFYRDIPIGKLYIIIEDIDISYSAILMKDSVLQVMKEETNSSLDHISKIEVKKNRGGKEYYLSKMRIFGENFTERDAKDMVEKMLIQDMLGIRSSDSALFFPASRTGMLLLYKYFFAEKDNRMYVMESEVGSYSSKNQLGLSAPVYNFLQFLLKFTPDNLIDMRNQEILNFIEKYLIDGKLELSSDESYYIPNDSKDRIPLYLSSSLINELAPIVKMLSNVYVYDNIYYDEIETCLHPLKQKAMARLIIRLVNSGRRMVISTHSDSMAVNVNNLLTFTLGNMSKEAKEQKMKELGLEEADILKSKDVYVYQFTNSNHGTSSVNELKFRSVNNLGYDFELFNQNLENLSEDTIKIME